jgi:hypothetical protein
VELSLLGVYMCSQAYINLNSLKPVIL